jgi:sterol desaturase/sphingolipid hydroxylase (fatty acid hydroxylase superfamily)
LPNKWYSVVLAVFVADFCYYWKHRYEHQWSYLWAQHVVHHSSKEFNYSTSLRLPWIGSYLNWPFFVPALFLGFTAAQILLGHQIVLAYQYIIHTEMVNKMGFLERILNTPSHHRVHHGRNSKYLDKNYSGIFIFWDRIFGTFEPEAETVNYGTVHPMESKNPVVINLKPWLDFFSSVRRVPGFWRKIQSPFLSPQNLEDLSRP